MDRRPPRQRGSNMDEILARLRRIETRQVQHMVASGIDTQSRKPTFARSDDGSSRLDVPSPHSSLKEMLDSVPDTWQGPVDVFIGDQMIASIRRG